MAVHAAIHKRAGVEIPGDALVPRQGCVEEYDELLGRRWLQARRHTTAWRAYGGEVGVEWYV